MRRKERKEGEDPKEILDEREEVGKGMIKEEKERKVEMSKGKPRRKRRERKRRQE